MRMSRSSDLQVCLRKLWLKDFRYYMSCSAVSLPLNLLLWVHSTGDLLCENTLFMAQFLHTVTVDLRPLSASTEQLRRYHSPCAISPRLWGRSSRVRHSVPSGALSEQNRGGEQRRIGVDSACSGMWHVICLPNRSFCELPQVWEVCVTQPAPRV